MTTRLAGVRCGRGQGDCPWVCRLCDEALPRILPTHLMVSLPVHVSCFDLNIVYTNMFDVIGEALLEVMVMVRRLLCTILEGYV